MRELKTDSRRRGKREVAASAHRLARGSCPRACVPLKMPAGLLLLCGATVSNACERSPELKPRSLDWSSHKALSGPFVPLATFAPLALLPGSTAELRADNVDDIENNRSSGGLAAATGSMRTGELSMGLGHLRSEAAPLQHVQHLAQISMASTVAAFESPCVIGGGTDPLAWLSPEPDAESASGIEARRRIPYTLYLAKCCWPIAPAPVPPLRIGITGGPIVYRGHRDGVVALCGCNGPNHGRGGAVAGECSGGAGGGQVHGAGLRQPRGARR